MPIAFGKRHRQQVASPAEVYTSLLGGHGVYVPTQSSVRVLGTEYRVVEQAGDPSSQYYAVPLASGGDSVLAHWCHVIDFDAACLGFVWPVDLAANDAGWALVFPTINTSGYRPLSTLAVNWTLPDGSYFDKSAHEIERNRRMYLRIAANLLRSWKALNRLGFLYLDYDMAHVLYNDEGQVLFSFNVDLSDWGWEHPAWKVETKNTVPVPFSVERPNMVSGLMPLDYVDPITYHLVMWARDNNRPYVALPYTEMFAMHAVAYRLTVGCLPFYGPQLSFHANEVGDDHVEWVRVYQDYHVFGFDSSNAKNRLGSMANEEAFVRNWRFLEGLDDEELQKLDLGLDAADLEQLKSLHQEFYDYFDGMGTACPQGINWKSETQAIAPRLIQQMVKARS